MSKLSPSLKAMINAPLARPGPTPASGRVFEICQSIALDAARNGVGNRPWIAISAAATFTLNSPDGLHGLYSIATNPSIAAEPPLPTAELIREVGLKCIGFNGIPRTINCLGAFRANLPQDIVSQLSTTPTRLPTPETLGQISERGRQLWGSIYAGVDAKLLAKLAESHPDLPVHILNSHYGPLFSDPPGHEADGLARVGRALTSLVAIACLRAQTGVGPQVVSHILGLRKSVADGTWKDGEGVEDVRGVEWLATDEGSKWILRSVDVIVEALSGANFAVNSEKAKL